MWFYIMMFICNLLIPIVMLICGFFMSKYPPKEINGIIGYRTTMDTWKFAHDYCGKLWLKLGLLLLIPTIIIQIPFSHSSENVIGYMTLIVEGIQFVAILGSIVFVERALKFSFVVDISFLHLIRKIAYLNFCTNELSWGIKKGLVDSYARVIVNLCKQ